MTPDDITRRLEAARNEKNARQVQDQVIDKVNRVLNRMRPEDQMVTICALQAALILELGEMDREKAVAVWQAAWSLSATMIHDMVDALEAIDQETKH